MKNNRQNELLRILSEADKSIPAAILAGMLGASERTVRNYIKVLNESGDVSIVSSREGYRLEKGAAAQDNGLSENEARSWQVLSDLLTSKEGINAFDEAERLFVSASTVVNVIIPRIKSMVKEYGLCIESSNYQFYLKGSEWNKRRLIGYIATSDSYSFWNTDESLLQLFPHQDVDGIMQELYPVFQKAQIYLNDYSLNNLMVHILVILIRLQSGDGLEEQEARVSTDGLLESLYDREEIKALADMISANFMENHGIQIPERDYQQILILIALSAEHETVNIRSVISHEFISNVTSVLSLVSERYCIPEFDNDFIMQFVLHVYYAYQRCAYQMGIPNPVGPQLKKDYAPVYDMAVFFAHNFDHIYQVSFNEDEIAFIAFHFGAYLENSRQHKELVTCTIVVESYHSYSKKLVSHISETFKDRLLIRNVLSISCFLQHATVSDLVITTLPVESEGRRIVQVSPILTRKNIDDIRGKLDQIEEEKKLEHTRTFFQSLFHKELYFRNLVLEDEEAYIRFMGQRCLEQGYIKEAFIQDVVLRESVSSTAFTDVLAMPHAISQNAERSFICVVHNNMPIRWGRKTVHFILLVGIARQEMKYFTPAFDLVVDLFNSTNRTIELLKTGTFEEFCRRII
ncbi:MAG: transcription antiterminator [Hungatella sp.]|nr:transcription antiterminator [Hungatella sp.]